MPRTKEDFKNFDCETLIKEAQNINGRIKELKELEPKQELVDTKTPEQTNFDELTESQDLFEELLNISHAMREKKCMGSQNVIRSMLFESKNNGWPINIILKNGKKYTGIAETLSGDGVWRLRRLDLFEYVNFNEMDIEKLNWVK